MSSEIKEVDVQGYKKPRRFLVEDIKKIILANVPSEAEKEYEMVLEGVEEILRRLLQNHLSKFIHLDTGKLLRMPLKEDTEYLFLTITGIVRYLSKMSLPSSK
jgi:23S rRNA A2030 N6-methylase RlmJ